jgi:hypothetical protein
MVISGAVIYVNSVGVKLFSDLTFYTAGKNLVVGVVLLTALALSGSSIPSTGAFPTPCTFAALRFLW